MHLVNEERRRGQLNKLNITQSLDITQYKAVVLKQKPSNKFFDIILFYQSFIVYSHRIFCKYFDGKQVEVPTQHYIDDHEVIFVLFQVSTFLARLSPGAAPSPRPSPARSRRSSTRCPSASTGEASNIITRVR